ncbi:MAG TPA: hypothetical protein VKM72_33350 [Thermoanaerobaculia bacterium]|nr:hypothetical protein [Thermoanaerobaculia bacterium]
MNYRYQYSHRHFVGSEEQHERAEERSQVKNTINLAEIGVRYNPNPQWSFSLNVPYFNAERSSPIRDSNRVVVDRSLVQASGLSDITLSARRLLWKPLKHPDGNIAMGLGVKIPTGEDDVFDDRERLVNGQRVFTDESVDQSIQPGDGGWGVIFDLQYFQRIAHTNGAFYASTTYLANPRATNGVPTFRNGVGEEVMSVSDQYVARIGASYAGKSWKGFGASLGGRLEGVPVEDLIGDSNGFRRPGYAISAEPGVSYSHGPYTFSLAVPIALYRNRTRSVPDRLVPGRHGDAAFADYVILFGWGRKY